MKKLLRGLCLAMSIALIGFALVGCGGGGSSSDKKATANITVTVDDPSANASMRAADAGGEVYVQAYNSTGNSTVGASGKATLKNGKYTANLIDLPKTNDLIVKAFHSGTKDDFFKALLPMNNIIDNGSLAVNAESSVRANAYSKWISVYKPTNDTMDNFETNLNKALGTKTAMEYFGVSKENANDATKITEEKIKTIGSKDDPTKDITYISATFTPSNNQLLPVTSKTIKVTFEEEVEWDNSNSNGYFKMEPNDSACTYSYSNKVLTVTREKDWAANSKYVIGINAGLKVKGATNKQVTEYAYTYTTESGSSSDDPNAKYFAGGKGIADDPYLINTAEQLKAISTNEDTLKACYKLNADITLTGEWEPIGGSSAETQTYRGDSTAYDKKFFSGSLDGNGKTISGLTINKSGDDYVGMFRATKSASFRNINLVNVNVTGKNCVGALVAFVKPSNDKSLVIENCQVSGRVNANCNVGGLVGESQGYNILNTNTKIRVDYTSCKSSAIVTGTSNSNHGGLVGSSVFSKYTNCEFSGTVTGIGYVGGISGFGTGVGDTYESCVCSGNVNGFASDNFAYAVGGITSSSNGVTFTKCTVTATITANGHTWVGALAFYDDPERITINNCDVSGVKIIKK